MGKHRQAGILAAADFMLSSDPSSGLDYNYQNSLSGRSLPDSENTGDKSGGHAQAPAEYHGSMARGTKSGTWTRSEKDCLDAVLLLDDYTRYHRIGSAVRTPCLRAYVGCLLTRIDGKIWLSAKKPWRIRSFDTEV
jgi:hypothetical protein